MNRQELGVYVGITLGEQLCLSGDCLANTQGLGEDVYGLGLISDQCGDCNLLVINVGCNNNCPKVANFLVI